jgi:putative ABC transport system permease protein
LRNEITGRVDDGDALLVEYRIGAQDLGGGYLIRSRPGQLPQALKAAAAALQKANPGHVENKVYTMAELRENYFKSDLAAGRMLVAIMLILLVVTALGVSGLASFWVQQRRRQIGIRRALGATRGDILGYYHIENFLIVSGGVVLGAVFAYALNLFLMRRFELAHLPADYLLAGALALWVLGQLAVLGPALRAAAVPPVAATRSV